MVSLQTVQYVKKCASLSDEQRQTLVVSLENIIFLLPEEVSLLQDDNGTLSYRIVSYTFKVLDYSFIHINVHYEPY